MACNLQPDTTGAADFTGTEGNKVNLTLKGTGGTAFMTGAVYNQTGISTNPATFTIVEGDRFLSIMTSNSVPNDVTMLVCDDGTVLDRFHFDGNNPARNYDVRGVKKAGA